MHHSYDNSQNLLLFEMDAAAPCPGRRRTGNVGDPALGQYFTPAWAAEELYEAHFSDLGPDDLLVEPGCGRGDMLGAVPQGVPAFGVEIDPTQARLAKAKTGRNVIVGDFREVPLPEGITAVFGNAPFDLRVINGFLARAHQILPCGGKAGLILPAYAFQTSRNVVRWASEWTISQEAIPRDLFPGLKLPLVFALFQKDEEPKLIGFRLYRETRAVREMPHDFQRLLIHVPRGKGSVWKSAVGLAIQRCGGTADIDSIYRVMESRRPTPNPFWKEKVRQTLRRYFERVAEATYTIPAAA